MTKAEVKKRAKDTGNAIKKFPDGFYWVRSEYMELRKTLADIFEKNIDKVYRSCKEELKKSMVGV